jgi:hypothetical protein
VIAFDLFGGDTELCCTASRSSRECYDYTAEIGPESLWLCVLAPEPDHDDSVELDHFDKLRLTTFFEVGRLR